jgi:photosystem II stability/assembly factor-like uncharacterized protein
MKKLLLLITLFTLYTQYTQSQWVKQTIPVNKPISGIKFIDSLKGWACTNISALGDTSFIMNTNNGGENWNIQYTAPNVFFNSLFVINSSIVYIGGYDGGNNIYMLLKSTNGGLNWVNQNPPSVPSDLFFINQDSGWYCDDFLGADVRTTTNGGQTWILRTSGLTDRINRLFFLNYSTGWAGSRYLNRTSNAGLNWVQIYDFGVEEIFSMYFLNEQTGWAGMNNNRVRYTTNGGTNWILYTFPTSFGNLTDIAYFNSKIYFGNRTIRLLFTTNNGVEWGYQIDSSASYRISFVDSLKGWSGDFGISKTTNGGGPIFYLGFTPEGTVIPKNFTLYQNYPNPFNPYTNIKLDISESSVIKLYISDILGRVHYEVINQYLVPGKYEFNWDSRGYSSGVYFYTLISDKFTETKKMLLIK